MGSFYIGRVTMPPPSPFDIMRTPMLADDGTAEQLDQQIEEDHRDSLRLKSLAKGMDGSACINPTELHR